MDDTVSIAAFPGGANTAQGPGSKGGGPEHTGPHVYLVRSELSLILNIYGRMVAAGKWRDYAIDMLADRAIFSIFKRTSDVPLYQIVKEPALRRKQGQWRVVGLEHYRITWNQFDGFPTKYRQECLAT